ncbi:MAG: prepilin-type N-terminal cleavage/methylation domain-containing protein [Planctomycetota bacterium]|jgi:prepilin-type N-terminal cleavage/methylation domain-containing protein
MYKAELMTARRVGRSRGFTFAELLAAVAILGIVAVGIASAMVQAPRLSRVAREEMIVRSAMRGMVAEISAAPYSEVAAAFAGQGFEVPGLPASDVDADKLPGAIRIDAIQEGTARYYRVTLTVDWQGVSGARTLQSVHYVSNVRGDTAEPLPEDTDVELVRTISTDPNISYYEDSPVQPEPVEETPEEEDVPESEPVDDPVDTVPTTVNGKDKTDGKTKE